MRAINFGYFIWKLCSFSFFLYIINFRWFRVSFKFITFTCIVWIWCLSKKKLLKTHWLLLQLNKIIMGTVLLLRREYAKQVKSHLNYFSIKQNKQFFFSFSNMKLNPLKTTSTGVILANYIQKFKFFKKSFYNINPLVFRLMAKYSYFFMRIYLLENLNYTKYSFLLLKKLIFNKITNIKFLIFSKTWRYVTNPKKRVKRRVLRIVKKL